MGSAGCNHHVVDRGRDVFEERLQLGRIVGVEGRGVAGAEFGGRALETVGIAPPQDDGRALGACPPGGLKPDSRAAADDDNGLVEQFRCVLSGHGEVRGCHGASRLIATRMAPRVALQ